MNTLLEFINPLVRPWGFVLTNHYSPEPTIRTEFLIFEPEKGIGQIGREWRTFWMNDKPKHLTPEHLHGGIGP
jgi:hypothetical protein